MRGRGRGKSWRLGGGKRAEGGVGRARKRDVGGWVREGGMGLVVEENVNGY